VSQPERPTGSERNVMSRRDKFYPAYINHVLGREIYAALLVAGEVDLARQFFQQATRTPLELQYISLMDELYLDDMDENDYDIDRGEMIVSIGDDGAYVNCWRWVEKPEEDED